MRRTVSSLRLAVSLALAAPLLLGCTILDELDASAELMDKGARSIGSKEIDEKIVSCRLPGGRTQFMARPQCLASRGTPSKV